MTLFGNSSFSFPHESLSVLYVVAPRLTLGWVGAGFGQATPISAGSGAHKHGCSLSLSLPQLSHHMRQQVYGAFERRLG